LIQKSLSAGFQNQCGIPFAGFFMSEFCRNGMDIVIENILHDIKYIY